MLGMHFSDLGNEIIIVGGEKGIPGAVRLFDSEEIGGCGKATEKGGYEILGLR